MGITRCPPTGGRATCNIQPPSTKGKENQALLLHPNPNQPGWPSQRMARNACSIGQSPWSLFSFAGTLRRDDDHRALAFL